MAVGLGVRAEPEASDSGGGEERWRSPSQSPEKKEEAVEISGGGEERSLKSEVAELRRRWELASVLNFLTVFEPLIGRDLKISAEEVEAGLISPNSSLVQLHITLLKGIPPVSKALDGSDAWLTVLYKKLAPWWPWVAEGEIPLTAAKGEEISEYKGLDPTDRLLILKALCEVRVEQEDTVAYINDALKQGTKISSFCKDKIGGNGSGTSFWYDGNPTIGHRLYRGVTTCDTKEKSRGKECLNLPSFKWETLATNLEEFRKVVDELSLSKLVEETVLGRTIEAEAIPVLEKLQKKKEIAMKKKQKQEMLLNHHRSSYGARGTRSCRNRRPVNYTYDDYDRAIGDAIQQMKKGTKPEELGEKNQDGESRGRVSAAIDCGTTEKEMGSDNASCKMVCPAGDNVDKSGKKVDAMGINIIWDVDSDVEDYAYSGKGDVDDSGKVNDSSDFSDSGNSKQDSKSKQADGVVAPKHFGVRWSMRLAGGASQSFVENRNLGTKKSLRQRPMLNSALNSVVVPDSEDDS